MDDSVGGSISHSSVGTAPITLKHVFGLKTGELLLQILKYFCTPIGLYSMLRHGDKSLLKTLTLTHEQRVVCRGIV